MYNTQQQEPGDPSSLSPISYRYLSINPLFTLLIAECKSLLEDTYRRVSVKRLRLLISRRAPGEENTITTHSTYQLVRVRTVHQQRDHPEEELPLQHTG